MRVQKRKGAIKDFFFISSFLVCVILFFSLFFFFVHSQIKKNERAACVQSSAFTAIYLLPRHIHPLPPVTMSVPPFSFLFFLVQQLSDDSSQLPSQFFGTRFWMINVLKPSGKLGRKEHGAIKSAVHTPICLIGAEWSRKKGTKKQTNKTWAQQSKQGKKEKKKNKQKQNKVPSPPQS